MASYIEGGVFEGTGPKPAITGRGVSLRLDGTFVATVELQFFDEINDAWVTARSYDAPLADPPMIIDDIVERQWRLNCTAYTSGTVNVEIRTRPNVEFIRETGAV